MNLSVKMSLSVLAGLVALLGVLGYFCFSAGRESTDRTMDERLVVAGIVAHEIDQEISRRLTDLQQFAPGAASGLQSGDVDALSRELLELRRVAGPHTLAAFVLDRHADLVAAAPAIDGGPDALAFVSARQPIDMLQPAVHAAASQEGAEDGYIALSAPVPSPSGELVGAIGLILGPSSSFLESLLPPTGLGQTGYAEVIDETGAIIASTAAGEESEYFPITAHQERFAELVDKGRPGVWTCHRCHEPEGEEGGRRQDIVAFSPLTVAPWGVAIRQSRAEAFAPRNQLETRFLVSGGIALAVALAATLLIGQTLARPLRRLTRASQRISAGDLQHPIAVGGKDEVGQLGVAFETMRQALIQSRQELEERSRALAMLEERERLAREMHDSLSQTLNYIRLSAAVGKERLERGDISSLEQDLEQVRLAARDAYEEVRQGIWTLRTNGVLERGLLPALKEFVDRYCRETGLQVRVALPRSVRPDLTDAAQVQALRIVQEALANIRKHAGASRVSVEFVDRAGWVQISISDDGSGFDPATANRDGQHYGLQIMRERAESVGGTLEIISRAGEGTRIVVRLPAAGAARGE